MPVNPAPNFNLILKLKYQNSLDAEDKLREKSTQRFGPVIGQSLPTIGRPTTLLSHRLLERGRKQTDEKIGSGQNDLGRNVGSRYRTLGERDSGTVI